MAAVPESAALPNGVTRSPPFDDVWTSIARGYAAFASPWVPCSEEISTYEREVRQQAELVGTCAIDAVMLGVTPGIALMRWPTGSRITAVDISPGVIDALWPGDVPNVREAKCATWFEIPKARNSCDVIIGDGSLNVCRFPMQLRELGGALACFLKGEGVFIVRAYVRPGTRESVDAVFDDLFSGKGLGVDVFKMRLYLAMQRTSEEGVAVREAATILDHYNLDCRAMRERFGWSWEAVEPFSKWRASDAIYSFPTLDELREALHDHFDEVSASWPDYEMGHCCPTLVMRRRAVFGKF